MLNISSGVLFKDSVKGLPVILSISLGEMVNSSMPNLAASESKESAIFFTSISAPSAIALLVSSTCLL